MFFNIIIKTSRGEWGVFFFLKRKIFFLVIYRGEQSSLLFIDFNAIPSGPAVLKNGTAKPVSARFELEETPLRVIFSRYTLKKKKKQQI